MRIYQSPDSLRMGRRHQIIGLQERGDGEDYPLSRFGRAREFAESIYYTTKLRIELFLTKKQRPH